ncbi:MAG: hypothetical protein AB7V50_05800, partial [Vampirovibrionia bacterium]
MWGNSQKENSIQLKNDTPLKQNIITNTAAFIKDNVVNYPALVEMIIKSAGDEINTEDLTKLRLTLENNKEPVENLFKAF